MKTLMSFVLVMPMILAAAPLRAQSGEARALPQAETDRLRPGPEPYPRPYPRYCPEGTHRVFDEYSGRYICVPNDDFEPHPLPWYDGRMKELSGKLGGDDMSAKGVALDGLFDAAQARKSEKGSVSAGSWGEGRSGLARPMIRSKSRSGARIIPVVEPEHRDMMKEPGQALQDKIIGQAIDKAIEKVEKVNKAIDSVGNGLRSDGDSALQKGTEAQKKIERKYGK